MAITNASSTFPTGMNYEPRMLVVDDTLTRVSIKGMTASDIEGLDTYEVGLARVYAGMKSARICGVKAKSMADFVTSRFKSMTPKKAADYPSIIQPFTLVPREHQYNCGFFQIEAGAASALAGTGSYHPGLRTITVNLGSSPWVGNAVTLPSGATIKTGSSGVKDIEKFFLTGQQVLVEYKDADTNVAKRAQFKVVSAINATSGTTEKATITIEPCYTSTGWAALTAAQKAVYAPTAGQVNMLANSISNYESWGYQKPSVNNMTFSEYWKQTMRWSHSWNDEYVRAMEAQHTTEFFKKFQQSPIAKQRAEQYKQFEDELINSCWFGQAINENQTSALWQSLEKITDPANAAVEIEYRSNTVGWHRQIDLAGMVNDKAGVALNLNDIMTAGYYLKRLRGSNVIDCWTDRGTKGRIRQAMFAWYKNIHNLEPSLNFQPGQKITFNGLTLFEYDLYDIPDEGYQLAVFTDDFFDDRLASFSADQKDRGRMFMMIDPSDVAVNVLETNSVKRETNEADELYRHVIKLNRTHTLLESMTIEARVGDPNRHLIIENFSSAAPALA